MCVALCSGPGLFFAWPEIGTFQKKTAAVLHGLNPMVSGSEASSARIFYPECGSQDILFPYTELPIDDFWL